VQALVRYTLDQPGNENIRSVNALVGETNDSKMNDIRGMPVTVSDVMAAIASASDGVVAQGSVGAGTGTVAFGYKGGIGSASRKIPDTLGGYTVGVLVQANFGGVLQIDGVPIGRELGVYPYKQAIEDGDGSCLIIVATDAPLDARNLRRLAKRGMLGLARTGGFASNGSGDYVIAFSTFAENFVSYGQTEDIAVQKCLTNDAMSPLFLATVESTEEAILNAIFMATIPTGHDNAGVQLLPHDRVMHAMRKYGRIP
jgi:D-aminopeptidase